MSNKYEIRNNNYIVTHKDGSTVELSTDQHKELLSDYCVRKESTENICLKYGFGRTALERYRRALGFTRDSIPVSDEETLGLSEVDLAKLIVERKAAALERAQDLYIDRIQKDAADWQAFQKGVLKPFEKALGNFAPKGNSKLPTAVKTVKNDRYFVVGLSDLQIGLVADQRSLFRQQEWNTEKAKQVLRKLLAQIQQDVKNDKVGFAGGVLILAGDLFHGLRGQTEKGTRLEVDMYAESQCDAVLEVLHDFVSKLHEIFGNLSIHGVKGNHGGLDDYPVMLALKNYYRTIPTIKTNIYSTRTAVFKISNTMIVLDHGASDKYKADIPNNGKQRESYIQSLLLSKSKEYSECNSCLFIQGDKHHYEQHEYNDFEFLMFGCLPLGDQYSDNLNLNSRSRQNCLIIDKTGLKSVLHYYIDAL